MKLKDSFLSVPGSILIGSVLISVSILISGDVIKFRKPQTTQANKQAQAFPSSAPSAPEEDKGPAKVSTDDDPVLGDKNAPVTIVEFSDYECPFCKRHYTQARSQLLKNYIDTGKVKLVFRDYPLPFHDPMATTEAMAASCAREQGGDGIYFKFHDEIFKRTTSNGKGLSADDLSTIAVDLGLNSGNLKVCLDSEKYKDEVEKDKEDGAGAGISGTPSFVIAKSGAGELEGTRLVGAQPFSAFKVIIDQLLK